MKKYNPQLNEIRKKLQIGDRALIIELLKEKYSEPYIRAQLNGGRTLTPLVALTAFKVIDNREKLLNPLKEL